MAVSAVRRNVIQEGKLRLWKFVLGLLISVIFITPASSSYQEDALTMTEFRLEKKLPPCKVTKDLLESLEKYILDKRDKIASEIGKPPDSESLKIAITDDLGEESVNSAQLLNKRFFSSTTEVVLEFYASWYKKDTLWLTISFSNKSYRVSSITIRSKSDTARELAVGMSDSLDKIIQGNKTLNGFFHPSVGLSFIIFTGSFLFFLLGILLLGKSIGSEEYAIGHTFWRLILLGVIGFAYLYFGPKIHPYTIFDSPRMDQLQLIGYLYKTILVGSVLSLIIYPFLSKKLFGQ